jgi:hypothetical protein
MSAGGRQTALDPAVGALPGANAVPLDQLSASERSTSWRTRFLLREWVAGSLFVIPTLYMATALALAEILPRIEGSRDVLSLNFANDTARTFYSAVAGGMIAFTGLVVSIAVVVVQFGASQYTPRLVSRFRRDPIVKHALGAFIAPAMSRSSRWGASGATARPSSRAWPSQWPSPCSSGRCWPSTGSSAACSTSCARGASWRRSSMSP